MVFSGSFAGSSNAVVWASDAALLAPRSAVAGTLGDADGDFEAFIGLALQAPLANAPGAAINTGPIVPPTVIASPVLNLSIATYTIGTTDQTQIAGSNAGRQFLLIQNQDKTNAVQVSFGAPVAAGSTNGLLIGPGGNLFMDVKVANNAVFASGAAGATAAVIVAVVVG